MATPYSDTNSDDLAVALHSNLTSDVTVELPYIDLNDPMYNLGSTAGNPLYAEVNRLTLEEVTTRQVGGEGAFDALMDAYSKHLDNEYEKGRITGTEYSQAYIQFTTAAMQQSIQFLMGKDQAYWQALLVQAQAKAADVAIIQSLVELARLKADYNIAALGIDKAKADIALTRMQLASEDARFDLLKTQDDIEEYKLSNLLPAENLAMAEALQLATEQRTTLVRERAKLDYEITTLLPDQHNLNLNQISVSQKQGEKIDADISLIEYEIQQMSPAKLLHLTAETAQVEAVTSKHAYELSTLMPDQHAMSLAEISEVETRVQVAQYDLTNIKPVELAHVTAQTSLVTAQSDKAAYELATLLPDAHTKNLKDLELADNQILKTEKDIEMLDYQILNMLPAQLQKIQSDIGLTTSQRDKITAEIDSVMYTTNFMMPSQRENVIADTQAKTYQASHVLPSQVASMEADTLSKEYTRLQMLPAQRSLILEQAEAKRAETLNTRTDGLTVTGSIGKQKDLYDQQITSYQRDSELKVGRMFTDIWMTQRTTDEGFQPPPSLNEASTNTVINAIKARNNLT